MRRQRGAGYWVFSFSQIRSVIPYLLLGELACLRLLAGVGSPWMFRQLFSGCFCCPSSRVLFVIR